MPTKIVDQLWDLIPTMLYWVVGIVLFMISVWLMCKLAPFSVRKEIEEDQNTALAIVMGAALIGIAIILASVIGG